MQGTEQDGGREGTGLICIRCAKLCCLFTTGALTFHAGHPQLAECAGVAVGRKIEELSVLHYRRSTRDKVVYTPSNAPVTTRHDEALPYKSATEFTQTSSRFHVRLPDRESWVRCCASTGSAPTPRDRHVKIVCTRATCGKTPKYVLLTS